MIVTQTIEGARTAITRARGQGLPIGLVPTMGALHAGHASLLQIARKETGFVAASIFVNPTQFGPNEDLSRYPRPLEEDLRLCAREDVDLVFHPDATVMYPPGAHTFVEVPYLQDVLCGKSRPGHFRGVATVVAKLFHILQPDVAYFGQKDAQQLRILQQMARDLNFPVRMRPCPIVRERDGLACSSRNRYLDADQRRQAPVLFQALDAVRNLAAAGERDAGVLRTCLAERIASAPGARLDYAEIVDADSLQAVERITGPTLVALAVYFGSTRLIDNVVLEGGT